MNLQESLNIVLWDKLHINVINEQIELDRHIDTSTVGTDETHMVKVSKDSSVFP